MEKKVYLSILIFTFFWNVLIFAAPYLIDKGGIFTLTAGIIYELFSKTCHQLDSRSFHVFGYKLAVCSRCVSVYVSFLLGCIAYPFFNKLDKIKLPSLWFLIVPFALLLIDVGLELIDLKDNTFLTRTITGGLVGIVLPFYLIPGFVNFFAEIKLFLIQRKK